jgi:NAD(P)-dependent dehydrogenase (short-subunit alcohol dehydrogenase family)
MHTSWSLNDQESLKGKVFVVTGSTSGLGLETATQLASLDATVVMTARNAAKGADALKHVRSVTPAADVSLASLDLTSLASVKAFAKDFEETHRVVDCLINNAGVMATPFEKTADGFELQIGTNHLGPFLLTSLLMPSLRRANAGRIVTVSSVGHRWGSVDPTDLNWERRRYSRWPAYFQSKLANLLFTYELDRRLQANGSSIASLAAHPGGSRSHLGVGYSGLQGVAQSAFFAVIKPMLMPTADGALPQLRAAIDTSLPTSTYVGPTGPGEYRGRPGVVQPEPKAKDSEVARQLWEVSCTLTGANWE